jgi:hypothetical protein
MPPTGKSIDISWIMNACRIQDGKIVEEWEFLDQLDLVRQLGLIEAPARPAWPDIRSQGKDVGRQVIETERGGL